MPPVRVNTFVQENDKLYIDPLSNVFIILDTLFGYFRLPLKQKQKLFYFLGIFYVVIINGLYIFASYIYIINAIISSMIVIQTIHRIFCSLFCVICITRLENYYRTLNKFDTDIGCRPKVTRQSLENLAQTIVTIVIFCAVFIVLLLMSELYPPYHLLILHITYTLEMNYYGHLLNLLVPRLKLINHYIESSLVGSKADSSKLMKKYVSLVGYNSNAEMGHCNMRKLMDLYHTMVEAYHFLIDAIKWQLLVTIIMTFCSILELLYSFSLNIIKHGSFNFVPLVISVLILIPLFSPCTFGDRVHHEVKRLRELLASKLYENKLDKSGRSAARALLAFTETRDLSFRLLRMLNIDISLPFKYLGLLITYLIILLQFEKVINPGIATVTENNLSSLVTETD